MQSSYLLYKCLTAVGVSAFGEAVAVPFNRGKRVVSFHISILSDYSISPTALPDLLEAGGTSSVASTPGKP
jgi:hypothetical protein